MNKYKILLIFLMMVAFSSFVTGLNSSVTDDAHVLELDNNNFGKTFSMNCQHNPVQDYWLYTGFDLSENITSEVGFAQVCFYHKNLLSQSYVNMSYCDDTFDENNLIWSTRNDQVVRCNDSIWLDHIPNGTQAWDCYNITDWVNGDNDKLFSFRQVYDQSGNGYTSMSSKDYLQGELGAYINWTDLDSDQSDLNFFLLNDSNNRKTSFKEGENFYTILNWTDTTLGNPINDTLGNCTALVQNGLVPSISNITDFLLCGSPSCDYETLNSSFQMETIENAQEDQFRIKACHPQFTSGDIIINIECGVNSSSYNMSSGFFPNCVDGYGVGNFTFQECINTNITNVSIEYTGGFTSRKNILEYKIDREYSQCALDFDNMIFNYTTGFYEYNHPHNFYEHGIKQINTSCVSSDPLLSRTFDGSVLIVNVAPSINMGLIQTSEGIFDIELNDLVEYGVINFEFFLTISDDDLDEYKINIYNSTEQNIYSLNGSGSFDGFFNVSSDRFRVFSQNAFNITIFANDTLGAETYQQISFNVTDNINPICLGLHSRSILNNTNISLNVQCQDQSFFSFNLTCDNGLSNFTSGLDIQNYDYSKSFLITDNVNCDFKYCDGHTKEKLSMYFIPSLKDKKIKVNKMGKFNELSPINFKNDVEVTYEVTKDRVKFNYDYSKSTKQKNKDTTLSFSYVTSPNSYYVPSDKYKGWIVDLDTGNWFDANLKGTKSHTVEVYRYNTTLWLIDITTDLDILEFESIGELNCVESSLIITASQLPPKETYEITPFSSLVITLTNLSLLFMWIFLFLMTLTLKGNSGNTIQFINILQLLFGFVSGSIWASHYFLIGFPIILISVGSFVILVMDKR